MPHRSHSKRFLVIAHEQIADILWDGKSITAIWRQPHECSGLMLLTRVQLGTNHLQRRQQRLYCIDSATPSFGFSLRPADLISAYPGTIRFFGSMNTDRDALPLGQSQKTRGDDHGPAPDRERRQTSIRQTRDCAKTELPYRPKRDGRAYARRRMRGKARLFEASVRRRDRPGHDALMLRVKTGRRQWTNI